jgi:hypothetical protein
MTEARNAQGRAFDVDRLAERLRQWAAGSAANVVDRIADAAREWAPARADDISVMAIKRC